MIINCSKNKYASSCHLSAKIICSWFLCLLKSRGRVPCHYANRIPIILVFLCKIINSSTFVYYWTIFCFKWNHFQDMSICKLRFCFVFKVLTICSKGFFCCAIIFWCCLHCPADHSKQFLVKAWIYVTEMTILVLEIAPNLKSSGGVFFIQTDVAKHSKLEKYSNFSKNAKK